MIHIINKSNNYTFSEITRFQKDQYDDYSSIDNRFTMWFKIKLQKWKHVDLHFKFGLLTKYYYCVRVNFGHANWDNKEFVRFRCYRNNELYNFKTKLLSK